VDEIERVVSVSVMIDGPVLFRAVGAFTEPTNLDRRWVLRRLSGRVEPRLASWRWRWCASWPDFAASVPATGGSLPPPGPR
jgi:hypothetical protein